MGILTSWWISLCWFLVLFNPAEAQTWVELFPSAPSGAPPTPVYDPSIAGYDAANNRLIVFFPGIPPCDSAGNSNEVWVLSNANGLGGTPVWTKLGPSGSPPFSNAQQSEVYDAGANRLIEYGGCSCNCGSPLPNVFVLANANGLGGTPAWSENIATNPTASGREGHSAVYDAANNRMISFAGELAFANTALNDTRILSNANGVSSPSTWTTLSPAPPLPDPRVFPTAVYDQPHNRMTIFGGSNTNGTLRFNDVWVLTNANGLGGAPTWVNLSPSGTPPLARGGHSAAYDSLNNRMIVFGGFDQSGVPTFEDVWQLSNANGLGGTPAWTQLFPSGTPPGLRTLHTAVFDTAHQRMIVFGGRPYSSGSNRVWVLSTFFTVIDIKPGSSLNIIKLSSGGTVPVAILSAPGFDATTVNPTTVTMPGASVKLKQGKPMASFQDVNGDGLLDLVVHFSTDALQLGTTDTQATLEGMTFDGTQIRGVDTIRVVR